MTALEDIQAKIKTILDTESNLDDVTKVQEDGEQFETWQAAINSSTGTKGKVIVIHPPVDIESAGHYRGTSLGRCKVPVEIKSNDQLNTDYDVSELVKDVITTIQSWVPTDAGEQPFLLESCSLINEDSGLTVYGIIWTKTFKAEVT